MIRAESLPFRRPRAAARGLVVPALLLTAPAAVGMMLVRAPYVGRLGAGVFALAAMLVIALQSRHLIMLGAAVWLTLMGLVRRALIPFVGWPAFDPLLLIGPIVAGLLWYTGREERRPHTPMSVLGAVLFGMVVAQVFNPASGSPGSAVFGALFWITPLMWFFVGRTFGRAALDKLFSVAVVLLLPVIAHGLLHSFGYFFPFEYTWVGVSEFGQSIFINGFNIRPFSSLTSPQEYGFFLAFGIVVLWSRILTERDRRGRRLLLFGAAWTALFLQGTRTVFVFAGLAMVLITMMRAREIGWKMLGAGLVAVLLALGSMHATRPGQTAQEALPAGSRVNTLAQHTITGLLNPATTTAPQHIRQIFDGLSGGFDRPFGVGVGKQTLVEKKIEEKEETTVENDIGAVFLVFGLMGGLPYLTFMLIAYAQAGRRYRRTMRFRGRPDAIALACVGVLVAFTTQWWAGQMYAASTLLWLVLGFLSRPVEDDFGTAAFEEQHANA